ncbi:hypothetical protein PQJ75_00985 [Rhodoplanes sp. TEM]|uniref:Uncharacterized protein n=1 Tax=Rhodoplanes tepidamans TaxID=200616 RepID=A0ABT5J597_RHOTP|nr:MULTISPECIES: hypothetical protein [Rhodoplanes]MDC7784828.1 hypothetical protein [Rhodoplanes tepidamans]MDC7982295.1 hypothetical protein [Rhodoplanes sp. TEM]MDQ0356303.1 hypothetical protein [Rhodoplanes tepidamans]
MTNEDVISLVRAKAEAALSHVVLSKAEVTAVLTALDNAVADRADAHAAVLDISRAVMAAPFRPAEGETEDCPECCGTGRFMGRFGGPGWPDCPACGGAGRTWK